MEVNNVFNDEMTSVCRMLDEADVEGIRELRQTLNFTSLIKTRGVDMIERVSKFVGDEQLYKSVRGTQCCEELFKILIDNVDTVDCLIALLEQLDEDSCSIDKFLMLLLPIQLTLLELSTSRELWLECALSTIESFIRKISPPRDYEDKSGEKKMVNKDLYVDYVISVTGKLSLFYESIISKNIPFKEAITLSSFGFHLLSGPVMYVYVEKFPSLLPYATTIVNCIDRLVEHVYFLFEWLDEKHMTDGLYSEESATIDLRKCADERASSQLHEKVSALQLALLYSIKTSEKSYIFEVFPHVFDKLYIFHKMLYLGIILLKHAHNAVSGNGLLFVASILRSIENGFIPHYYLELKVHSEFVRSISWISVHSYIFENRKLAVNLLRLYLTKFDNSGTFLLYSNVFRATDSVDVNGEIVSSFRAEMFAGFKNNQLNEYQKGKYLIDLLKQFSHLDDGADTCVLRSKNLLISTLHLFVLIFGRDINNETNIRKSFDYFEKNFFSVLKQAATNTRKELNKEMNLLLQSSTDLNFQQKKQPAESMFDVVVDGERLAPPKREEKIESVKNDLTVVHMIEKALDLVYEYARKYKLAERNC